MCRNVMTDLATSLHNIKRECLPVNIHLYENRRKIVLTRSTYDISQRRIMINYGQHPFTGITLKCMPAVLFFLHLDDVIQNNLPVFYLQGISATIYRPTITPC